MFAFSTSLDVTKSTDIGRISEAFHVPLKSGQFRVDWKFEGIVPITNRDDPILILQIIDLYFYSLHCE